MVLQVLLRADVTNARAHTHTVQRRIVAAYAALNARMTRSALIPGLPVPTADAGAMDAMQMDVGTIAGTLPAVRFEGALVCAWPA